MDLLVEDNKNEQETQPTMPNTELPQITAPEVLEPDYIDLADEARRHHRQVDGPQEKADEDAHTEQIA